MKDIEAERQEALSKALREYQHAVIRLPAVKKLIKEGWDMVHAAFFVSALEAETIRLN